MAPRLCVKCGTPLRRQKRFCSRACNRDSKQLWMHDMRQRYTYALRRGKFQTLVAELLSRGAITHEALLELAAQGYKSGYHAADKKWRARQAGHAA